MKTTIVIGCIVTICLLVLVPSVPAVEITNAKDINRTQLLQDLQTINLQELQGNILSINKLELRQRIFDLLSEHKEQFSIYQGLIFSLLIGFIGYILNVIYVVIWWIFAIPQMFLFGVWVIFYWILDSLGLIPYYKI